MSAVPVAFLSSAAASSGAQPQDEQLVFPGMVDERGVRPPGGWSVPTAAAQRFSRLRACRSPPRSSLHENMVFWNGDRWSLTRRRWWPVPSSGLV